MFKYSFSELYQSSVHQILFERKQSLHEANMATSSGSDQHQIRIVPSTFLGNHYDNVQQQSMLNIEQYFVVIYTGCQSQVHGQLVTLQTNHSKPHPVQFRLRPSQMNFKRSTNYRRQGNIIIATHMSTVGTRIKDCPHYTSNQF